jgi:hypothetical protein
MYVRCTVEYVRLTGDFQIFKNISKNKKYQPVHLQVMRSIGLRVQLYFTSYHCRRSDSEVQPRSKHWQSIDLFYPTS